MILTGENEGTPEENLSHCGNGIGFPPTLVIINSTRTDLSSNPAIHGERSMTDCLNPVPGR